MPSNMSKPILLPNSLVSPPEYGVAHDSFSSPKPGPASLPSIRELSLDAIHKTGGEFQNGHSLKPAMSNMSIFLSPPPSPLDKFTHSAQRATQGIVDPPLFDRERSNSVATDMQSPLFGPVDGAVNEPKAVVPVPATPPLQQSAPGPAPAPIAAPAYQPVGHSVRKTVARPTQEEYAIFVSTVFQMCGRNPREWLRKERGYLADRSAALKAQAERARAREHSASSMSGHGAIPPHSPGFYANGNGYGAAGGPARMPGPRPARLVPRARNNSLTHSPLINGMKSPRVAPNGGVAKLSSPKNPKPFVSSREDVDYNSIPDMCPPIDSLPNNPRCLKADWKGGPLDLNNDPDRHLLHPAEIHLASTLRLSCAQYLTSKRRIFQDRNARARRGYEFRKTDSQKACRIDVNKASKLWTAFERVGWFDHKWLVPVA